MTTAGWNYRDQETSKDWREDRSQIELYWNKTRNRIRQIVIRKLI